MVLETRYAVGDGLLIGTGQHWLLLGADPGAAVVDDLWILLSVPGPVVDLVLETLEKHFPEGLPSLALLDLTPGATGSATRGDGRVVHDGDERLLSVSEADGPPLRRLVGGVVDAGTARVREVAPPRPRGRRPDTSLADAAGRPAVIVGIPSHIMAARAPDRAPDPQRLALALDSAPRSAVTQDPAGSGVPEPYVPPPDAPAAFEPARPPEDAPAPVAAPVPAESQSDPDHDGHTTFRPALDIAEPEGRTVVKGPIPPHLGHRTSETVLAALCPAGHVTAAYSPECRVCHLPVPPQEPQRLPRPRLGVIALPSREVVPLDRGVVLGRKPAAVPGGEPYPHLVHLPADSTYLSRVHLQIELDGWLVMARDLGSQGGTRLHVPGRAPEQIRAHEAYALEPGHALDLAGVYRITFEVSS
ncbi:MAG: FHA domain-containing protein [Nocardioides sp.]